MRSKIWIIFILIIILFQSCVKINEQQKEGLIIKGTYTEKDVKFFTDFFKEMQKAVESEDLEKSISFYSKDFMNEEGVSLQKIKKNTEYVYKNYDNIIYKMSNIKITIKDDKAVSIDEFEYSAEPLKKNLKPLNYKGKERIYWQKENGEWKIINWVAEIE